MSEGHVHVNPAGIEGEIDGKTVSFDIQPLLLILVAACCVVTTVVIVKTYMERKNAKPMALGLFPAGSFVPATENGATADVKEAR